MKKAILALILLVFIGCGKDADTITGQATTDRPIFHTSPLTIYIVKLDNSTESYQCSNVQYRNENKEDILSIDFGDSGDCGIDIPNASTVIKSYIITANK